MSFKTIWHFAREFYLINYYSFNIKLFVLMYVAIPAPKL